MKKMYNYASGPSLEQVCQAHSPRSGRLIQPNGGALGGVVG